MSITPRRRNEKYHSIRRLLHNAPAVPVPGFAVNNGLAWAVNNGGPACTGVDGTSYEAESAAHG